MRMKALGANLPLVTSSGCTGSLTAARSGRWKTSTKPAARPPVRSERRESPSLRLAAATFPVEIMARLLGRASGRGQLDGLADPHIGAAAADISGHCSVDVGIIGARRRRQQRGGRHDLARLAIAA